MSALCKESRVVNEKMALRWIWAGGKDEGGPYVALRHAWVRHGVGQPLELGRCRKQRGAVGAGHGARVSSRRVNIDRHRRELGHRRRIVLVVLRQRKHAAAERGNDSQERQKVGAGNHFRLGVVLVRSGNEGALT